MDSTLKILLLLLGSPILILVLHIITSRTASWLDWSLSSQIVVMVCVALGNVPMGFILWGIVFQELTNSPWNLFWAAVYSLLLYNASGHVYFHLFNMTETALRIRTLREIAIEPLTRDALVQRYGRQAFVEVRLQRLLALGQIRYQGNRYFLQLNWLYIVARVSQSWRRLLGLDGG